MTRARPLVVSAAGLPVLLEERPELSSVGPAPTVLGLWVAAA